MTYEFLPLVKMYVRDINNYEERNGRTKRNVRVEVEKNGDYGTNRIENVEIESQ